MKSFSSKIGVLLAAAGSAVGLGSIWKFPYVVGENGGGAFIILYIVCALVFGLPLVMNEFLIGKLSGRSAYGAFRALTGADRWQWLSWTFLLSVFVITGWCFYYMVEAVSNSFAGMDATALKNHFTTFEGNPLLMITYAIVAIVVVALILVFANTLIVLSMTGQADWLTVMGQDLFTSFNVLSTNILILVGALGTALFSGWFVPKARYQGSRVGSFLYLFVLRWLVPIAIFIIFLDSVNII